MRTIPLVATKEKQTVYIGNSVLKPTKAMLFSKNFKKLYKEHLEGYVFGENSEDDEFDFLSIVPILIVVEYIKDGLTPIQLETDLSKGITRNVIDVWREVISENFDTLDTFRDIYTGKIKH